MRVFGEEEQQIIRKINTGDGFARNLVNIFESIKNLPGVRVKVNKTAMSAELLFECQSPEPNEAEIQYAISEHQKIIENLILHLVLLKYLEKQDLATFFEPTQNHQQVIEFGAGAVNMPSFSMAINDEMLVKLLVQYLNKEIVPSPTLRHLEKNNFRSDEELRFVRQQRATWTAIVITFLIGAMGIYSGHQSYSFQRAQAEQSNQSTGEILSTIERGFDSLTKLEVYPHSELERIANELSEMNSTIEASSKLSPEE
jgi:hypothetical protein